MHWNTEKKKKYIFFYLILSKYQSFFNSFIFFSLLWLTLVNESWIAFLFEDSYVPVWQWNEIIQWE